MIMAKSKSKSKNTNYRPTIQSLGRGLKLLDYVVSANKEVELGELAEFLGIEKSSAHRLMATLIAYGYILQDSQKRYVPGPAIMELASKLSNRLGVHDIAGSYLNELAENTGETAHLAVLGRDGIILTNSVASNHTLAVTSRVGESEPLHCTALGKAIICEMGEEAIKAAIGNKLKKYTDNTIGSVTAFMKEIRQVSLDRLAKDDEEFRAGVKCLAAPVRNFGGDVVAAIGISGPKDRLNDVQFEEMGKLVRKTGINLSKRLGFVFEK